MKWRTAYEWARAIFAIFGVLGSALALFMVGVAISMEREYQQRAAAVGQQRPASLEGASTLMGLAGIPRNGAELLGGHSPPWDGSQHVEAYCVRAPVDFKAQGWSSAESLDPFVARAALRALDLAHARLACVPDGRSATDDGFHLKLVSLELGFEQLETVRLAARDPVSGVYYFVDARSLDEPRQAQPGARAFD